MAFAGLLDESELQMLFYIMKKVFKFRDTF